MLCYISVCLSVFADRTDLCLSACRYLRCWHQVEAIYVGACPLQVATAIWYLPGVHQHKVRRRQAGPEDVKLTHSLTLAGNSICRNQFTQDVYVSESVEVNRNRVWRRASCGCLVAWKMNPRWRQVEEIQRLRKRTAEIEWESEAGGVREKGGKRKYRDLYSKCMNPQVRQSLLKLQGFHSSPLQVGADTLDTNGI